MKSLGGQINEKALLGRSMSVNSINAGGSTGSSTVMGHLLHSIFGLDHYPDYLKRWTIEDIETLEDRLEDLQKKVREQKAKLALRARFMETYQPSLVKPAR